MTIPKDLRADALDVDALSQEIRRVDGNNNLGAGALAEALVPFISGAYADVVISLLDERERLRGAMLQTSPLPQEVIAAAWGAWHSRHGGKLGPGPGFVEAIEAAISKLAALTTGDKP